MMCYLNFELGEWDFSRLFVGGEHSTSGHAPVALRIDDVPDDTKGGRQEVVVEREQLE